MTSSITQDPVKDGGKFPKLMTYDDNREMVFLVLKIHNMGMVGIRIDSEGIGMSAGEYITSGLIDFHGTIQLRNE